MWMCEHIEVIHQVTRVLKFGQVPDVELIPHSWMGNSRGVPGGHKLGCEGEPGAALVTST